MALVITLPSTIGLQSSTSPSGFLTKTLYAFSISPMHTTCTVHVILFDEIILVPFGEVYKL